MNAVISSTSLPTSLTNRAREVEAIITQYANASSSERPSILFAVQGKVSSAYSSIATAS